MSEQLIADAIDALQAKMTNDGMPRFHDARMAVVHAALRLSDQDVEHLVGYWLDRQQRLIGVETLAMGGIAEVSFSRRDIVRRTLLAGAAEVILLHNHPSGDARPSQADTEMAGMLDRALAAVGVMVAGHFIVAADGYTDVRAGNTFTWAAVKGSSTPSEAARCPHCNGPLEAA